MKDEIINNIKKHKQLLEIDNSQLDILIYYIEQYFTTDKPTKHGLIDYLLHNSDNLELGNSQVDLLIDLI